MRKILIRTFIRSLIANAIIALGLFAIFYFSGCASTVTEMNPKIYYKHDMFITVNNVNAEGVIVAEKRPSYRIAITSQADMDMLQITSCQRDLSVPEAIKSGWFKQRRTYIFDYTPTVVEQEPGCMLKLAGYEKESGRHSWAFIDFEDEKHKLPAGVACNGEPEYRSDGVTVCQSLQGLYQLIWFQEKVVLSEKTLERCKIQPSQDGGIHWKFKVQNRECIYEFMEVKKPYRRHRLTTVGYEDVPIRTGE